MGFHTEICAFEINVTKFSSPLHIASSLPLGACPILSCDLFPQGIFLNVVFRSSSSLNITYSRLWWYWGRRGISNGDILALPLPPNCYLWLSHEYCKKNEQNMHKFVNKKSYTNCCNRIRNEKKMELKCTYLVLESPCRTLYSLSSLLQTLISLQTAQTMQILMTNSMKEWRKCVLFNPQEALFWDTNPKIEIRWACMGFVQDSYES